MNAGGSVGKVDSDPFTRVCIMPDTRLITSARFQSAVVAGD